jgi:hypothetical protein
MLRKLFVLMVLAAALAAVTSALAGGGRSDLDKAKLATARFNDLGTAKHAGYGILVDAQGIACIDMPGQGAMGVHYVNGEFVGDTKLNPKTPEAVVYEPRAPWTAAARRARVRRLPGGVGRGKLRGAVALRTDVQRDAEPESVRTAGLLLASRLGVEAQSRRNVRDVESACQLHDSRPRARRQQRRDGRDGHGELIQRPGCVRAPRPARARVVWPRSDPR